MFDVSTLASGSAKRDDGLNKGCKFQSTVVSQLPHPNYLATLPILFPNLTDHLVLECVDHNQGHLLTISNQFPHLSLFI